MPKKMRRSKRMRNSKRMSRKSGKLRRINRKSIKSKRVKRISRKSRKLLKGGSGNLPIIDYLKTPATSAGASSSSSVGSDVQPHGYLPIIDNLKNPAASASTGAGSSGYGAAGPVSPTASEEEWVIEFEEITPHNNLKNKVNSDRKRGEKDMAEAKKKEEKEAAEAKKKATAEAKKKEEKEAAEAKKKEAAEAKKKEAAEAKKKATAEAKKKATAEDKKNTDPSWGERLQDFFGKKQNPLKAEAERRVAEKLLRAYMKRIEEKEEKIAEKSPIINQNINQFIIELSNLIKKKVGVISVETFSLTGIIPSKPVVVKNYKCLNRLYETLIKQQTPPSGLYKILSNSEPLDPKTKTKACLEILTLLYAGEECAPGDPKDGETPDDWFPEEVKTQIILDSNTVSNAHLVVPTATTAAKSKTTATAPALVPSSYRK
jgi:chemotaxis protein histidine kinase CheA